MSTTSRVLSFDIGIKNLAYCYLEYTTPTDVSGSQPNYRTNILDWRVIDLMADATPVDVSGSNTNIISHTCTCKLATTKKNAEAKICGKKAKYVQGAESLQPKNAGEPTQEARRSFGLPIDNSEEYFCETHAKVDKRWIIPKRAHEKASLNKLKREPLDFMVADQKIVLDPSIKSTKKTLVDALLAHFLSKSYTIINSGGGNQNSKHADLITLGRNMAIILDRISVLRDTPPTHIIMENQISTVASRMKTLQGELTMYFLLRHPTASVEYISSANKLKFFAPTVPNDTPVQVPRKERRDAEAVVPNADASTSFSTSFPNSTVLRTSELSPNQIYKKHKQDAITYTTQILQENPILQSWEPVLTGKKKDDLADSFLQGIWYLRAHMQCPR